MSSFKFFAIIRRKLSDDVSTEKWSFGWKDGYFGAWENCNLLFTSCYGFRWCIGWRTTMMGVNSVCELLTSLAGNLMHYSNSKLESVDYLNPGLSKSLSIWTALYFSVLISGLRNFKAQFPEDFNIVYCFEAFHRKIAKKRKKYSTVTKILLTYLLDTL